MKKTQRIFWPVFSDEEKLTALLDFFESRKELIDELSFFTEGDGGDYRVPPLEEIERRAEFLKEGVQKTRQRGWRVAINILNTLGHSDDGDPDAPPFRTMVGHEGVRCATCACPADEKFLSYIARKYAAYGRCQADTYWLDDDVRFLHHSPAKQGCFCEACVEDFGKVCGEAFADREDMVERLQKDSALRGKWMERNSIVMARLIRTCCEAIREGSPQADLGIMAGCRFYFQDQNDPILNATQILQSTPGEGQTVIRVGAGFWSDARPRDLLVKLLEVSLTAGEIAEGTRIGYELENYPFTRVNKSASITGQEVLLAILTNELDEVLLDIMDLDASGLSEQTKWLDDLSTWVPLWTKAAEVVKDTKPAGWRPVFSLKHWQQLKTNIPLFPPKDFGQNELQCLQLAGLPFSGMGDLWGNLLSQRAAEGMNSDELIALLDAPLIMDAGAALRYCELGLGGRIGIQSGQWQPVGTVEKLIDEDYTLRATSKYFVGCPSAAFQVDANVEILSMLQDYWGRDIGVASFVNRQNDLRVAVFGHLPETRLLRPARKRLWNEVGRTLASVSGPRVETDYPVVHWVRVDGAGTPRVLVLWNAGFDEARDIAICGEKIDLACGTENARWSDSKKSFILPPWGVAVFSLAKASTDS